MAGSIPKRCCLTPLRGDSGSGAILLGALLLFQSSHRACFESLPWQVTSRMFFIQDLLRAAHQTLYTLTLSLGPMNSSSLFRVTWKHPNLNINVAIPLCCRDFSCRKERGNWEAALLQTRPERQGLIFSSGTTWYLCTFMVCVESVKLNLEPKQVLGASQVKLFPWFQRSSFSAVIAVPVLMLYYL